jgi:hypothetical protein
MQGGVGALARCSGLPLSQLSTRTSLARSSAMTFALNVATRADASVAGNVWDQYSPLSKLITIAAVNNKAQFGGVTPLKLTWHFVP